MFRAPSYPDSDDLLNVDPSYPADQPIFTGSAFQQQTMSGPTFNDPGDDRVTFIGDAYDPTVQHMVSQRLPADLFSTGDSVDGGVIFGPVVDAPNPNPNIAPNTATPGAFQQQSIGTWYDTLRPNAGYQLPIMDDETYAYQTGDQMGEVSQPVPLLVAAGVRILEEKPLDMPSRLSKEPSTEQAVYDEFDDIMGAKMWSGRKTAMDRPTADPGPWYKEPLSDVVPSPTGAGGSMSAPYAYDLYPQPLTFRAPPTNWDTGVNSEDGYYVEGGY